MLNDEIKTMKDAYCTKPWDEISGWYLQMEDLITEIVMRRVKVKHGAFELENHVAKELNGNLNICDEGVIITETIHELVDIIIDL